MLKSDSKKSASGSVEGKRTTSKKPSVAAEVVTPSSFKKKSAPVYRNELRYALSTPIDASDNYDSTTSYDWHDYLDKPDFSTPEVHSFMSQPLSEIWKPMCAGMKLEVPNHDYGPTASGDALGGVFWLASVVRLAGYKVLLRYEGMPNDGLHDFWMNMCSADVHPVGWCAKHGKPIIPPQAVQEHHTDWKTDQEWRSFLAKRLTGSRTLPMDFSERVQRAIHSRFRPGMHVEVHDRNRLQQVRPAVVREVVGHRLHVCYSEESELPQPHAKKAKVEEDEDDEEESEDNDFWVHERSPLVHPVGWAAQVGHDIECSAEYHKSCEQKLKSGKYSDDDAVPDMFEQPVVRTTDFVGGALLKFEPGQKLEARDPLDLSNIVVATVSKILRDGYLMVRFDGANDAFCYHQSSPYIFPTGFCEQSNIALTPPKGCAGRFVWEDYLKSSKAVAAPSALFNTELVRHNFKVGQKLEATDLMDPRLVCVATVQELKGRLLRIHFDGWESSFDQWSDCFSPDLFPIGWAEMMGYKLEAPLETVQKKKQSKAHAKPASSSGKRQKSKKHSTSGGSQEADYREGSTLTDDGSQSVSPGLPTGLGHSSMESTSTGEYNIPPALIRVPPTEWNSLQVQDFLKANDVDKDNVLRSFQQHKIGGPELLDLTEERLVTELRMSTAAAQNLLNIIEQLNEGLP